MTVSEIIKEAWTATTAVSKTERWAFLFVMLVAIVSIIGITAYFLQNIREIVDTYNHSIAEQRREFLQTIKDLK